MTTTVDLLTALCAHLAEFELPAIASVHMAASIPGAAGMTVQLSLPRPPRDRRRRCWPGPTPSPQVTAQAWRVPSGRLRAPVSDRAAARGARIRVYGAMPVTGRGLGADLAPDATTTILLAALRHASHPREVTA